MSSSRRMSGSLFFSWSLSRFRLCAQLAIGSRSSSWVCSTPELCSISATVCGRFCSAALSSCCCESSRLPRSGPRFANALYSSDTVVRSAGRSTEVTSESMFVSSASADNRDRRAAHRDRLAALEVGRVVVRRDEVDVLLTDHRPVGDRGRRVHRNLGAGAVVDVERDLDAVLEELERAHPTDRDAAVGDLGVAEDAAGVGEVGVHGADAAAEEALEQPDVVRAHVRHPEQGDQDEHDQLDLGPAPQHGRITRPSRRGWAPSACSAATACRPTAG